MLLILMLTPAWQVQMLTLFLASLAYAQAQNDVQVRGCV